MIIQSRNIWISSQFMEGQIEIEEQKILAIWPYGYKSVDQDYGEERILPGMIDIHCHGGIGFDTMDANKVGLQSWANVLPQEGITSFLPTTVSQSEEKLMNALINVSNVMAEEQVGAEILGVHFEGPYINKKYRGVQPEEFIAIPNVEQFKKYQKVAKGKIKIITMACENDFDHNVTRYASQNGVIVSNGHSEATYEEAMQAIANGASSMTHVFSAMSALHHRKPAMVGAAMRSRDTYGEICCDGNHVDWSAVNAFVTSKGRDYAIMIDDALCAKGCPPGYHEFGGTQIEIRANGSAYLVGTDSLAGGTIKFNRGLQNMIEKALLPFDWAINMTSLNPARLLRIDDHKGKICAGYDADLTILNKDFDVIQTYCLGKPYIE